MKPIPIRRMDVERPIQPKGGDFSPHAPTPFSRLLRHAGNTMVLFFDAQHQYPKLYSLDIAQHHRAQMELFVENNEIR